MVGVRVGFDGLDVHDTASEFTVGETDHHSSWWCRVHSVVDKSRCSEMLNNQLFTDLRVVRRITDNFIRDFLT